MPVSDLRRQTSQVLKSVCDSKDAQLLAAAQLLLTDYESDAELTAFTILDGEDFHA